MENFCFMMNQKALELGANNTNFVTPHGLDRDEHYTTANDLLIFSKYLLNIPYLAEIVNTRFTTIKIDENTRELRTTNEMLGLFPNAKGIKTGYTGKAGRCLITAVESGDRELISIVLGCDTKKQRTSESMVLMNYGFSAFEEVDIYENMKKNFTFLLQKSMNNEYEISILERKYQLLPKNEKEKIKYEYILSKELVAPIPKETVVGKIYTILNGERIDMLEIKTQTDIERKSIMKYFLDMIRNQAEYTKIS